MPNVDRQLETGAGTAVEGMDDILNRYSPTHICVVMDEFASVKGRSFYAMHCRLVEEDMPELTKISSYLWNITTLIPGIPVLAIMVRYNLLNSGAFTGCLVCTCRVARVGGIAYTDFSSPTSVHVSQSGYKFSAYLLQYL